MKINFDAGPAKLLPQVINGLSLAINDYGQTGLSITEIGHRSAVFMEILDEANDLVLHLLKLSADEYEVIWMQGGGRTQFAMIPMNWLSKETSAGYLDSGHWASEAQRYAQFYGETKVLASSKSVHYRQIPRWIISDLQNEFAYIHLTTNNTIYGTQYHCFPTTDNALIGDFSSDIFSREIDYSRFDYIYAVAQKNIGPAGVTLGVVKKNFLIQANDQLPEILSYKSIVSNNSLVNTAPVMAIYTCLLTLREYAAIGMDNIFELNKQKANILYDFLDNSNLFKPLIHDKQDRSDMNVCFVINAPNLEKQCFNFLEKHNIVGVRGHRSAGGFRVSLYNAITINDVELLVKYLEQFELNNSFKY